MPNVRNKPPSHWGSVWELLLPCFTVGLSIVTSSNFAPVVWSCVPPVQHQISPDELVRNDDDIYAYNGSTNWSKWNFHHQKLSLSYRVLEMLSWNPKKEFARFTVINFRTSNGQWNKEFFSCSVRQSFWPCLMMCLSLLFSWCLLFSIN